MFKSLHPSPKLTKYPTLETLNYHELSWITDKIRDGSWWICSFQKIWESNYRTTKTTSQLAELRAVTADAQGGTKARRQQWQHHHSHQPWRRQLRTTNSSQFRRASWGLRPVYHGMSAGYAKTGLYRLHKPWLFSSGRARFSSKKYRNSFGKSPPALPHASGNPVESSSLDNPVESSSLDNPVESCSLDVLAVFAPKSIDWAFQFSTSTGAVVVDVCCSSFKWPKLLIWTWQG